MTASEQTTLVIYLLIAAVLYILYLRSRLSTADESLEREVKEWKYKYNEEVKWHERTKGLMRNLRDGKYQIRRVEELTEGNPVNLKDEQKN